MSQKYAIVVTVIAVDGICLETRQTGRRNACSFTKLLNRMGQWLWSFRSILSELFVSFCWEEKWPM